MSFRMLSTLIAFLLITGLTVFCWIGGCNAAVATQQGSSAKHLVGYVAGFGVVYRVDVTKRRILAEVTIPAPNSGLSVGTFLLLASTRERLYLTGDQFDVPVVVLDSDTLQVSAKLQVPQLSSTNRSIGAYTTQQFQVSPDGTMAVTFISVLGGGYGLQFVSLPDLKPVAWLRMNAINVGRQSAFVGNGQTFAALIPCRYAEDPTLHKHIHRLLVADPRSRTIRQIFPPPSLLKESVPAARFLPEAAGYYIVDAGNERWLLPGRDQVYAHLSRGGASAMVREVMTGRVLSRWRVPVGPRNPDTGLSWLNNEVSLTPDRRLVVLSRSTGRPAEPGGSGELIIHDRLSGKMQDRISLKDGATSNVVFRYE